MPDEKQPMDSPGHAMNLRVGFYYLLGSLSLMVLSCTLRPWGLIAIWPGISLTVVAAGYFGAGVGIYGKRNGHLPRWRRMLLAPVLFGQWLSWRHYAKRSRAWDKIAEGVWLGRVLTQPEAQEAIEKGVTAVLDVTGEFSAPRAFREIGPSPSSMNPTRRAHFSEAHPNDDNDPIAPKPSSGAYLNIPILDLTSPSDAQLSKAIEFINTHIAQPGVVYVHCKAGYSRSAAVVGAWLISSGQASSPAAAIELLKQKRPGIILRSEAVNAIKRWAKWPDRAP